MTAAAVAAVDHFDESISDFMIAAKRVALPSASCPGSQPMPRDQAEHLLPMAGAWGNPGAFFCENASPALFLENSSFAVLSAAFTAIGRRCLPVPWIIV